MNRVYIQADLEGDWMMQAIKALVEEFERLLGNWAAFTRYLAENGEAPL